MTETLYAIVTHWNFPFWLMGAGFVLVLSWPGIKSIAGLFR